MKSLWKLLVRAFLALTFVISNVAPNIKAKVEKIWSLCRGKAKMPHSKLIAKKFAFGIVAEKFEKGIFWVAFIKKTNTNQHSSFFKRMYYKLEVQQKDLNQLKIVKHESQFKGDYARQKL
jgi:hypothetical protein